MSRLSSQLLCGLLLAAAMPALAHTAPLLQVDLDGGQDGEKDPFVEWIEKTGAQGQSAVPSWAFNPSEWRRRYAKVIRRALNALEDRQAPSLETLVDWDGTAPPTWKELEGKVVLLHYFTHFSPNLAMDEVTLAHLHRSYKSQGLVVLGVHGQTGSKKLPDYIRRVTPSYRILKDEGGVLFKELNVRGMPTWYLMDGAGRLRIAGANGRRAEEIVRALLGLPMGAKALGKYPTPHMGKELHAADWRGKQLPALGSATEEQQPWGIAQWLGERAQTDGKVVLIDLWATWCKPCVAGMPKLEALAAAHPEDLVVIGLSNEPVDVVAKFLETRPVKYKMGVDPAGRLYKALGVQGIPQVVLLSSDGVVRWQGVPEIGPDKLSLDLVTSVIAADPGVALRRALALGRTEEVQGKTGTAEGSKSIPKSKPGQAGKRFGLGGKDQQEKSEGGKDGKDGER